MKSEAPAQPHGSHTPMMQGLTEPMIVRSSWEQAVVLVLPSALFLLVYALHGPDVLLIQPDSEGYLTFASGRIGGYPAFLASLLPFIHDVADYALAQRLLYSLAVLALGYQLLRSFGSPAIALVAEAALLFNPEVNRYHFVIVTESLYLSTSALFLAAALAYLRTGRLGWFALASALAAYAVTVRPAGVVLLPLLVILLLAGPRLPWRQIWKYILVAAVAVVVILSLESIYYRAHHEGPRVSLAPIHLLAKAGMVDAANAEAIISAAHPDTQPLQRALEVTLASVRRLIDEAPNQGARCKLIANYEVFVQYQFAPGERAIATARGSLNLLTDVALARLKHAVGGYMRLTSHHLLCLWSLGAATKQEQAEFTAYLESRRPLPFEKYILEASASSRSPPFATAVVVVMYSIAALLLAAGVVLIGTLIRRRPSLELAAAGLAGLIVHGSLLFTALTGVGIARYVLGLWVPIAVGVGMSALWIIGSLGFWRAGQTGTRR